MKVGYVRVSKHEQSEDLQKDAMVKAGVEKFFYDKASGAREDRPGLAEAMAYMRAGDTLVVWKLDRLGRSLSHLITIIADLGKRGIDFASLTETIDTNTPGGRLIFHVMGAIAQFERDLIRERTTAGLAAARARGRKGGRKPVLTEKKKAQAQQMYDAGIPAVEIQQALRIASTTFYRYIKVKPLNGEAS